MANERESKTGMITRRKPVFLIYMEENSLQYRPTQKGGIFRPGSEIQGTRIPSKIKEMFRKCSRKVKSLQ